jgi:hypothetical protein
MSGVSHSGVNMLPNKLITTMPVASTSRSPRKLSMHWILGQRSASLRGVYPKILGKRRASYSSEQPTDRSRVSVSATGNPLGVHALVFAGTIQQPRACVDSACSDFFMMLATVDVSRVHEHVRCSS